MTCKHLFPLILALLFFVFSCKSDHPLDKKEAINNLRILNSEILSLVEKTSGSQAFQAMEFLWKQSSSPLPFNNDTSVKLFKQVPYSFARKKGVYVWDTITKTFIRQKDTSLILLHFPLITKSKAYCRFFLYAYETRNTRSRPGFPITIEAKLFIDGHEELSVSHHAALAENMPSEIKSAVHCCDFNLRFYLLREGDFSQKSGVLKGDLKLEEGSKEILSAGYSIDIDYHPPLTYSFRYIRFLMKVFDSELKGKINYGAISPTSDHYASEFNSNSSIILKNLEDNGIIGNIVLSPVDGKDKLDFFIRFTDGTESILSDHIILKKILNLKY
jgi:hypothetical protein